MPELQPGVAQEVEREVGMAMHARTATTEGGAERVNMCHTEVRELRALDIAPDQFHGIQLRGIARQAFDGQPSPLARQISAHRATPMGRQSVPDQDHRLALEVVPEIAQEGDQRPIGIAAWLRLKQKPRPAPIPPESQRAGHRQPLPVAADRPQDGRGPARGPRPADDRLLRETAFVLEDEPRTLTPGVFFSCAQRRVFHASIAGASRSRACRVGRWSDHPSRRSSRQT